MFRPQKGNSGVLLNDILLNIRFKDALKGLQTYFQVTLQFYNIVSFKSLSHQAEWDILVFLTKIDFFQMLLLAHTMKGFVKIQTTTFSSFYKWKSIKITSTVPLRNIFACINCQFKMKPWKCLQNCYLGLLKFVSKRKDKWHETSDVLKLSLWKTLNLIFLEKCQGEAWH